MFEVRSGVLILAWVFLCAPACSAPPQGGGSAKAETAKTARELEIVEPRISPDLLPKAKALKNPVATDSDAAARGGSIYKGRGTCVLCHGARGTGDGDMSSMFNPPPRNFKEKIWQSARTDGEIFWAIKYGTEEGMPRFEGKLSDEEMWALVTYVRSLGK